MCHGAVPLCFDISDFHFRQVLAMTLLATVVVAALFLEDDHLVVAELANDLSENRAGLAELAIQHENVGKGDLVTFLAFHLFYADDVAALNTVLLPAGADN